MDAIKKSLSGSKDEDDVPNLENIDKESSKKKVETKPPKLKDIPKLAKEMVQGEPDEATIAAQKLYELCDVAHKDNREPMVASGKYDVLNPLSECLLHDNPEKLHFVCLTLNNLSIPYDNKRVMVLERVAKKLIQNLCTVIQQGKKQAYLCIIILTNLSYYEPGIKAIGQFSPKPKTQSRWKRNKIPPLENPHSLMRIMQELTAHAARGTADFRWAFGLLAQLSKSSDNAILISVTAIPQVALENIKLSKTKPSEWKTNSLEDFSLFLLMYLAEIAGPSLTDKALEVVEPIMQTDTGVQGLKATMMCSFMEIPWEKYPNYGVIAGGIVSELMSNTFERKGKKNTYEGNVFQLRTATKAYSLLAKAAGKADAAEEDKKALVHSKVMALPTAIALLFQILSEITANYMDDDEENSFTGFYDPKSGEFAVASISSLLPALLQLSDPPRESVSSEIACSAVAQLFENFATVATSIPAKAKASETAEKMKEHAGTAVPLLEASYDLWQHATASTKSLFFQ
mmetsp:Transcript_40878/g.98580  ORF Transcript_40878/g.98580 Transcript_40878/m.98580 type:complete len:515 (-) Transcript_40878:1622-3166(-)